MLRFIRFCLIALPALLILTMSDAAFAGGGGIATDFRGVTKNVGENASGLPVLFGYFAYIIGTFYAVRALLALRGFISDPDDNPLTKVMGFAFVSALLLFLPFVAELVMDTLAGGTPKTDMSHSSGSFSSTGDSSK